MSIENVVAMEVEAPIKKEKKSKKSKKTVEPVVEDEVASLKRKAQEEHEDAPKKKKSKKNKEAATEEPVAMETEEKTEKKEKKKKSKKNKEAAAEEEKVEEVVEDVEGEKKDKKKKSKSEPAPEESPEEDEAATPTATEEKAEEPKAEGAEECLTVFVGGLPWSAEEATVKKDFEECGEMVRFAFLTDRETGQPKGSCFIDYATTEGVKKALEFNETDYGGRTIYVREATPGNKGGDKGGKKGKKGKGKGKGELRTPGEKPDGCTSVVVKNFTYSTTEDSLWKLFEGCGEISRLKLLTDRETGESKGIAFVDFASAEGVDEAIKKCNQEVEGRAIFVDYSGGKGDGKKGEGKKGDGKKGDGKKGKGKKGKGKKGECSAIRSANQGSIVEATGAKKTFDDSDSD